MFHRTILFAAGCLILLGCERSTPSPSDPALARETLNNALAAWKKGDSHEAYKQAAPNVTVVDRYWQKGVKLLEYELPAEGSPDGYDVQFRAKLTTQEPDGKSGKKTAIFNVSTTPALVIVRLEPGG